MDEALAIIDVALRGEALDHRGSHLTAAGVVLGPRPLQQPRPPMWLGALRRGGVRKAAQWDGWIAVSMSEDGSSLAMTPQAFGELLEMALSERAAGSTAGKPFDAAVLGVAGWGDVSPADFADVGATWWLESLSPMRGSIDDLEAIVRAGPPAG
jgi:hypothetical protein